MARVVHYENLASSEELIVILMTDGWSMPSDLGTWADLLFDNGQVANIRVKLINDIVKEVDINTTITYQYKGFEMLVHLRSTFDEYNNQKTFRCASASYKYPGEFVYNPIAFDNYSYVDDPTKADEPLADRLRVFYESILPMVETKMVSQRAAKKLYDVKSKASTPYYR